MYIYDREESYNFKVTKKIKKKKKSKDTKLKKKFSRFK